MIWKLNLFGSTQAGADLTAYQTHLADHCNLNCKGCGHFCNLVKEPIFADLEQYSKDVTRLSELYWNVSLLQLLGGEPLLNSQLEEFIKVSRKAFPAAELNVYSNGLLVTRQPESLFETMRENRCAFRFSAYKPIYKKRDELTEFLGKRGIIWSFTGHTIPIETFSRSVLLNPEPVDATEIWSKCRDTICHVLEPGYLYPCGGGPWNKYLEEHFDVKINHGDPEKLRINLETTTLTGHEINALLDGPHEACKYCGTLKMKPFDWETRTREKAMLSDYAIDAE
ncbi:MAG: radical SAM protein [Oscillospiraceae bacterium]|jgi:hypothetical protein|nr:radical SAM protein [Oscillospiraceae bacterium]